MSVEQKSGKLSVGTKLGFGICDLGGNIYFTTIGFWLMFYLTDVVGLNAALAGYAIMIGRIVDAVTDPLMGYISDRTKSKIGRRRLYLLIGSVPMLLTMFFLFTNPGLTNQSGLFVWAAVAFSLVSIAFTIVNIPYSSLTPELTTDFNERTSLNGFRMSFAAVGTLVAAGATLPLVNAFRNQSVGFSMMGLVFGALTMGATLVTFFSVREPASSQAVVSKKGLFRSYVEIFKNKPYLLILVPWICNMTGVTIVSSMLRITSNISPLWRQRTIALLILIVTALILFPFGSKSPKRSV
jgi:GPH family glycoside/pentoside/hexuronide:cation symporter